MTPLNPAQTQANGFVNTPPAEGSPSVGVKPALRRHHWRSILLRALLTLAVIALLFWQVPWTDVVSTAAGMQLRLLIVAILLWLPAHALQLLRWAILARHAGKEATWRHIFRSYWVGFTLAVVTPGRVGQFGRCFALNVPVARGLGVSLLERFYASVVLFGAGPLALAAMILGGVSFPVGTWRTPLLVGLCLMGTSVLLLGIFPRILLPVLSWIVRRLPLREKLGQIVGVLDGMHGGLTLGLLALSLSSTAVALVQFVVLLYAMGIVVPFGWGMLAVVVNFFLKASLPISIAGLGVGEWTAVLCLSGLGVAPAAAVAGSLVLFAINVLTPALLGIPVVPTMKLPTVQTTRMRHATTQPELERTAPVEQAVIGGS
jgi:uncharacterized membrane protein YbhN (UPF0104 family)